MIPGMHLTSIGNGDVLLEPSESLDPGQRDGPIEALLGYLQGCGARRLIYDLKNVALIDSVYYDWLKALHAICQIAGIQFVVIAMRPVAAYALAGRLSEDPPFQCALDVQRLAPLPTDQQPRPEDGEGTDTAAPPPPADSPAGPDEF
jgi:anti-anti-sigma regulatory factor